MFYTLFYSKTYKWKEGKKMKIGIHLKRTSDTEYVMYICKNSSTLFEYNFITMKSNVYHLSHDNPDDVSLINNYLLSS